jgi:hypothetical protein
VPSPLTVFLPSPPSHVHSSKRRFPLCNPHTYTLPTLLNFKDSFPIFCPYTDLSSSRLLSLNFLHHLSRHQYGLSTWRKTFTLRRTAYGLSLASTKAYSTYNWTSKTTLSFQCPCYSSSSCKNSSPSWETAYTAALYHCIRFFATSSTHEFFPHRPHSAHRRPQASPGGHCTLPARDLQLLYPRLPGTLPGPHVCCDRGY